MSDLAEKILAVVQSRLDAERAKTRDVVKSYCPRCGEYAPRYSIADLTDVTDMMKVPVVLFPCVHTVVWDTIRREQETVSLADEDLIRIYAADREIVDRHARKPWRAHEVPSNVPKDHSWGDFADCAHCNYPYPCPDVVSVARGYGVQPTPGDDHA